MNIEKMRGEFEIWAKSRSLDLAYRNYPGIGQFYECPRTLLALEAWQASREAVVVDLPPKISAHNTSESGWVRPEAEHYDEAIDDCREAIEFQGLKVK